MRKIYSFLLALVATCICTTAALADDSISITINVDDASRVKVSIYYEEVALVNGDNVFKAAADAYQYVNITAAGKDYGLKSVMATSPSGTTTEQPIYWGSCDFSFSSSVNGYKYTVTSYAKADYRTAKCLVKVDNASKVDFSFNGSSAPVALQNGDNEIAFIPVGSEIGAESPFSIRASNGSSLYKVLCNGEAPALVYGAYEINAKDGDTIEIQANWPDKDVPVHFVAGNAGTEDFIESVKVDGTAVDNWNDANFTVKLGSNVEFAGNMTDYKVESILVNGEDTYFYGQASFFVGTEETQTITYTVTKYNTFNIVVNIDHADRITLNKMVDYSGYPVKGLKDGENVVELSEKCSGLSFTPKGGCRVESFIRVSDGKDFKDINSWESIPVEEGDTFAITTWEVARESSFVLYIDDPSKANHGGQVKFDAGGIYANQSVILPLLDDDNNPVDGGYYTFNFDPDFDNPLQISIWADNCTPVYYQCDTIIEGGTSVQFPIADKDVIKVFLAGAPDTLDVTFAIDENCAECAFNEVVRDIIVAVEDVTAPFAVLTGTQVSFKQTGADEILVNDEALAADENGLYTVTITADTRIVAKGQEQAIENAEAALNRNVYTLQGMLLIKDATPAQINALPAGLYIISGKTTYLLQH